MRAPFGAARFRSQKRPNWTAFSRPASQWRLSPPSVRPSQKSSAFPGSPIFAILRRAEPAFRQENFRLSAGNFAWTRRSARLAFARKRGRTGRLSAAQLRNGGFRRHLFGRPRKAPLFRVPLFFNPQAGRARLPAKKFPAFSRKFCLDAPFGAARFRSQKRPNWTAFSRPASRWRPWPPSARPLFCCGPCRSPRGCRSGPPPRKSAYRGRGPPRR